MKLPLLVQGPLDPPIISMALVGGGGAPFMVEPRQNFAKGYSSVSLGKVREVIRMHHCWSLLCLVSLGLWLRSYIWEESISGSWLPVLHVLLLRLPECAGVLGVSVLASSAFLRRRRCPWSLQW